VAGALTERDFVAKLEKAGFEEIRIRERQPTGIDELALYPLFTDDLLGLMRRLIPQRSLQELTVAVVLSARLPPPLARSP
jgi:arsenite methyltransferase